MAIETEIRKSHELSDEQFAAYERQAEHRRQLDLVRKSNRDRDRAEELFIRSRRRIAEYPASLLSIAAEALTIAERAEQDGMKVSASTVVHLCEALFREYSIDVSEFIAD